MKRVSVVIFFFCATESGMIFQVVFILFFCVGMDIVM